MQVKLPDRVFVSIFCDSMACIHYPGTPLFSRDHVAKMPEVKVFWLVDNNRVAAL
jgi:hypothetical protein